MQWKRQASKSHLCTLQTVFSNHYVVHIHQSDSKNTIVGLHLFHMKVIVLLKYFLLYLFPCQQIVDKILCFDFHTLFVFFAKLHHFENDFIFGLHFHFWIILNRFVGIYGNTILKLTYFHTPDFYKYLQSYCLSTSYFNVESEYDMNELHITA